MRCTATLFAVMALMIGGSALAESDVLVLTDKSFHAAVDSEPLALVEFYAPWCGHCKALAPEYEEAATALKDQVKIAKVDCTEEKAVCEEFAVQGYPTLKLFREGKPVDYQGARKADAIVSYLKKQQLPALSLLTAETHDEFSQSDRVVVIAYLPETEDSPLKEAITKVASALREEANFGITSDPEAAKAAGLTDPADLPALLIHRSFDEPRVTYTGDHTEEAISAYVKAESVPLIDELGPDNFMKYVESGIPLGFLFLEEGPTKETLIEGVKAVAKSSRGKVNLAWIDAVKFAGHAPTLNLKEGVWPAFAIQDVTTQAKFPLLLDEGVDLTAEAIAEHVSKFIAGEVEASIKSEPIPPTNDGPVKIIVADQYEEIVNDPARDVLVEFYAPWCGHCKKLAPLYEELASKYAPHAEKLTIAKMDTVANDLPVDAGFTIEGFPTIKLIKAGTNEVVDYDGDRSEESFIEFITANTANNIVLDKGEPLAEVEEEVEEVEVDIAADVEAEEAAEKKEEAAKVIVDEEKEAEDIVIEEQKEAAAKEEETAAKEEEAAAKEKTPEHDEL